MRGDRGEFMTYPCNHRGILRHSEIKHGKKKRKKEWRYMRQERKKRKIFFKKMEKRVKWRWKEILGEGYMLQMLSFDCKNHGRLANICGFPLKTLKKNVLSLSLSPPKMTSGNADLIFFFHRSRSQRLSISPKKCLIFLSLK